MKTDKLELVETHNLMLALRRLRSGSGGYDDGKWKRALYHAICCEIHEYDTKKAIREALRLP